MFAAIMTIYFLIGLAHWCAHLTQCDSCKEFCKTVVLGSFFFFIEGAPYVIGWPAEVLGYIRDWNKSSEVLPKYTAIRIEKRNDESAEDFQNRIGEEVIKAKQEFEKKYGK